MWSAFLRGNSPRNLPAPPLTSCRSGVTPGTAGLQRKLAFSYNSGGKNGALGIGWSISALSMITRVPQTLAQDNAIHGVDMTLSDRYAMDRQRLILVSGAEGSNAVYRTEISSFTKVTYSGASGQGRSQLRA
ncbi:MAG: SpvB/TcaC N-terminal domain-containing protein [Chthoniobacterales bacterium]